MSNGEVCCILGICCPSGSEDQRSALIREIQKQRPHMTDAAAALAADRVLAAHDDFADVVGLIDSPATAA